MKNILITGVAGFIGYSVANKITKNYTIIGIDNLNSYYDLNLKKDRLKILNKKKNFYFFKIDLLDSNKLNKIFKKYKFSIVINLAAQAGVRYSVEHPEEYLSSNIIGFYNLINLCKTYKIDHLIYASSSSVYGNSNIFPSKESHNTDQPLSFYAATKKTNELIAYSFANIYSLPSTGLRFFTVYGPYGRPDMAPMIFANKIFANQEIDLFNNGNLFRDFTFIDYAVKYVKKILNKPPNYEVPHRILNIGNKNPVKVLDFLKAIEKHSKIKVNFKNKPLPKGDVKKTFSDITKINQLVSSPPKSIKYEEGVKIFIKWYKKYYQIDK